jgi:choline dehydrogenase-like flavoprotein
METIAIDTESRSTTSTHNMSTKTNNTYTYIIAGGGLAGSTLASLLSTTHPSAKILVIEAGPDVSKHPLTSSPLTCFGAHNSPLDWAYTTVPQAHLNNRECYNAAAKALGGASAINYGTWTRGDAADYDRWAEVVGDEGWSMRGFCRIFERLRRVLMRGGMTAGMRMGSTGRFTMDVSPGVMRRGSIRFASH